MHPLTLTIPGWAVPWLGVFIAIGSIATMIANATSHITDAQIETARKQSPRFAALLTWARHWGIVVWPGLKAAWIMLRGAVKVVPAVMVLMLLSCGAAQRSWSDNAHIGVNLSTHGLRDADTAITAMYASQASRVHEIAQLDAIDARYRPALEAERVALASLQAAEHAIDTALASGNSADKCLVHVLLLRARTHTDDAIRIAQALGVTISPATIDSLHTLDTVLAALAPSCSSPSPTPAGGSL